MKKQKCGNVLFWVIFIIVVAGGLWYYYKMPKEAAPPAPAVPEKQGVEAGDLVAINFVLSMANGSVVDTNDEALAAEYSISTFTKGQFRFILGQSGKVNGFDEAIIGAEPGENFTRIITPSEQVLRIAVNRTRHISRNLPLPRFQPFSPKAFEKYFGKKPVMNDIVSNAQFPWPYKVVNMSDPEVIVCDPVVTEGRSYRLPSLEWNSTLLVVTYNDIVFRHNPVDGSVIHTELGEATVRAGIGVLNVTYLAKVGDTMRYSAKMKDNMEITLPQAFQVTEANDERFVLTRINYLPQETLVLKAQLLEWQKDVKEVKEPLKTKPVAG